MLVDRLYLTQAEQKAFADRQAAIRATAEHHGIGGPDYTVIGGAGLALSGLNTHVVSPDYPQFDLDVLHRYRRSDTVAILLGRRSMQESREAELPSAPLSLTLLVGGMARALTVYEGYKEMEGHRIEADGLYTLPPAALAWKKVNREWHQATKVIDKGRAIAGLLKGQVVGHAERHPTVSTEEWRSCIGEAVQLYYRLYSGEFSDAVWVPDWVHQLAEGWFGGHPAFVDIDTAPAHPG